MGPSRVTCPSRAWQPAIACRDALPAVGLGLERINSIRDEEVVGGT